MKKKIAVLIAAVFLMTILSGTALAVNCNNCNKDFGLGQGRNASQQLKHMHKGFSDIEKDWGRDEIMAAVGKGFINGYGDYTYRPNQPVTNLEVIVTLVRASGIKLDSKKVEGYGSLLKKIPDWGKVYVAAAIEKGILLESEMKNFNPNQGVKRYQLAVYMFRITGQWPGPEYNAADCLNGLLNNINKCLEILEELDDDTVKDFELESFIADVKTLQGEVKDLNPANIDKEDITAINNALNDLINEIEDIIEDVEEDELLDDLNSVLDLLNKAKNVLGNCQYYRFIDRDLIPVQAREAARWMQRLNIMMGDTDGAFSPMRVVKRNELAAMLNRLDNNCLRDIVSDVIQGVIKYIDDDEIIVTIDSKNQSTASITDDTKIYYRTELIKGDMTKYTGYDVTVYSNSRGEALLIKIMGKTADKNKDGLQEENNKLIVGVLDAVNGAKIIVDTGEEEDRIATITSETVIQYKNKLVETSNLNKYIGYKVTVSSNLDGNALLVKIMGLNR